MKQSLLFNTTLKTVASNVTAVSHELLIRAGYITQITAGRFSMLPLGFRVYEKIIRVIDREMRAIGVQRVVTPTLHPIELWKTTNRDKALGEEMTVIEDHHGATFALGATAEGLMTEIVKSKSPSYRNLPILIYQFSQKFRDEKRPRGGLLRLREFMMKDAYSFHASEEDLLKWYETFKQAYARIAEIFDLKAVPVIADSGAIGGDYNHEFMVEAPTGENAFIACTACKAAFSLEKAGGRKAGDRCGECQKGTLEIKKAIEWGHIFHQGQFYAGPQQALFTDQDGKKKTLWQGAYGIGIERTMATIVETHHDEKGIIWPSSVTPFHAHLLDVTKSKGSFSQKVYQTLEKEDVDVLYDDRDIRAGEKFAEADLLGMSVRLVIGDKSGEKIEWKERACQGAELLTLDQTVSRLKKYYA